MPPAAAARAPTAPRNLRPEPPVCLYRPRQRRAAGLILKNPVVWPLARLPKCSLASTWAVPLPSDRPTRRYLPLTENCWRNDDLVAFVACSFHDGRPIAADEPVFLTVAALRSSVNSSTLGPPKSASEGAERDRTWPATVPSRDGTVLAVNTDRIVVQMHADRTRGERRQTYRLKGRNAYVGAGETFKAHAAIISGVPPSLADLSSSLNLDYDPIPSLGSTSDVDRYAAVRALAHRHDLGARRTTVLENVIDGKGDDRVVLEAAGVAASVGSAHGKAWLSQFIWTNDDRPDLRMEAVFILTELGDTPFAREHLTRIAGCRRFRDDELRQSAVWGLGKSGLRRYDDLLSFTSSASLTTRTTMSLYMPSLASIAIRRLPPSSAWWTTLLLAESVGGLRLQQRSLPSVLTR